MSLLEGNLPSNKDENQSILLNQALYYVRMYTELFLCYCYWSNNGHTQQAILELLFKPKSSNCVPGDHGTSGSDEVDMKLENKW